MPCTRGKWKPLWNSRSLSSVARHWMVAQTYWMDAQSHKQPVDTYTAAHPSHISCLLALLYVASMPLAGGGTSFVTPSFHSSWHTATALPSLLLCSLAPHLWC